jgi:hypothetical protein
MPRSPPSKPITAPAMVSNGPLSFLRSLARWGGTNYPRRRATVMVSAIRFHPPTSPTLAGPAKRPIREPVTIQNGTAVGSNAFAAIQLPIHAGPAVRTTTQVAPRLARAIRHDGDDLGRR